MTRKECEQAMEQKLREVIAIYKQYNPDGKYLSMTYLDDDGDGYVQCNNRCWDKGDNGPGEDYIANKVVDFSTSQCYERFADDREIKIN